VATNTDPPDAGKDMAFPDRRATNILLTILLFVIVFAALYAARRVLLIFVFAILFAYLIDPVVSFLQRHSLFFKNLRGPHVVEAYLGFLILAVVASQSVAPLVSRHAATLIKETPAWIDSLTTGDIAMRIGDAQGWSQAEEWRLKAFLVGHRENLKNLTRSAEQFASNAMATLLVVPILSMFFLADGRHIAGGFIQLVSIEGNHQAIREIVDELNIMLRKYIRAKVVLGGCSFVFYSAAMLSLRFPYAIGMGVLGGILEFVPVAGWTSSAAIILSVGFLIHCHWNMDGIAAGHLENNHGLLYLASHSGEELGNPPIDGAVCRHGRRGDWRYRGYLSLNSVDGRCTSHLAEICLHHCVDLGRTLAR
jgi:predicted PurR-regulated permease PerM